MDPISAINAQPSQSLFGTNNAALGKEDFLRILVTQLRNQDPINPVNSENFATQLAQFSSLEQLQNINDSLGQGIESDMLLNQAINNTMATTLIGQTVRAAGNVVAVSEGKGADINFSLGAAAKKVTIEIRDANGSLVKTVELEQKVAGDQKFEWDGKDSSGNQVAEGKYQFSVQAEDVDGNAIPSQEFIVGEITGIRYQDGGAILVLGNLNVSLGSVIQIGNGGEGGDSNFTAKRR